MRVTTQMLNESARKAGLPLHDTSLLNYINKGNSGNGLLDAISNKNGQNTGNVSRMQKYGYEKMEKLAGGLCQSAEALLAKENSLFDKAKESGDTKDVVKGIENMVNAYNDTLQALRKETGAINRLYLESLKSAVKENATALKNAGVTVGSDGQLVIDKEKLSAADLETLEKAFGPSGDFTSKVSYVAGKVEDNAAANLNSISNQYTSGGNAYTAAMLRRYDNRG